MQAALLRRVGQETLDLVDDITLCDVAPNLVRVGIRATGVCHTDLSIMQGVIPYRLPCVLGHEGAGEVLEVGSDVRGLSVGDHVVLANVPACGVCRFCLRGETTLCADATLSSATARPHLRLGDEEVWGLSGTGTFAEEVLIHQQAVVTVDAEVPWDVASLIGCGVTTGLGAVFNTARVTPGSSVVVFGCGGVGIATIQGARIAGAAEIVAVDLLEDKRTGALAFGATHAAHPDELAQLRDHLTGGAGFDFGFEVIGLPATMRATFDAVRRGGTAVVVGAGAASAKVEFNAFELFYHQKNLRGSFCGAGDVRLDFDRTIRLWRYGRLDLEGMITKRGGLADVNTALDDLRAGNVIRTVLTF